MFFLNPPQYMFLVVDYFSSPSLVYKGGVGVGYIVLKL